MSITLQSVLWTAVGVIAIYIIVRLIRGRRGPSVQEPAPAPAPTPTPTAEDKVETAKEAFLRNVEKFSPILPQLNSSLNIESWTEQIVDINNPQLTTLWKRCLNNIAVWKQLLSSWGLRQDTCTAFTFLDKYGKMYDTADGSAPEEGCKYRVIDGCWILTDDHSGAKRIIKKGVIEKL